MPLDKEGRLKSLFLTPASMEVVNGRDVSVIKQQAHLLYRVNRGGQKTKILFITSSHNRLSQRRGIELTTRGHAVAAALATNEEAMKTRGHRSSVFKRKRSPRCVCLI
jgi:hypothetical protein